MNTKHKFWGFSLKMTSPEYLKSLKKGYGKADAEYKASTLNSREARITMCPPLLRALAAIRDNDDYVYGMFSNGNRFAVIRSKTVPEMLTVAVHATDGKVYANKFETSTGIFAAYAVDETPEPHSRGDGKIVWLALIPLLDMYDEFKNAKETFLTAESTDVSFKQSACLLSDSAYRQIITKMIPLDDTCGYEAPYPSVESHLQNEVKELHGNGELLDIVCTAVGEKPAKASSATISEDEDFNLHVELLEEQKPFLLDEDPGYVVPKEELYVLKSITKSRGQTDPAINFLMTGPPGTGKTSMARHISTKLGLPYYTVICSEGTTEDTLLGCIFPELVGESDGSNPELDNMPEPIEVFSDPVGSYEKMTGERDKSVTIEDVLSYMVVRLKDICEKGGGTGIRYKYQETPLIKAFKYGGVCEIQDIGSIASATVMTVLNDVLNSKDGIVNTPVGDIRRHENCIIIASTNSENDIGYSHLNQAVRDRFRVVQVLLPPKHVMIQRVKKKTGYSNAKMLDVMADVIDVVSSTIKTQSINGVCGMRAFNDWVVDVMNGLPFKMAMENCVFNRATTQIEELRLIRDAVDKNTRISTYI